MEINCGECRNVFETRDKRRKFCSVECYHKKSKREPTSGAFKKGHSAWNKNVKGTHLSPNTEFKKGQRCFRYLPVGTETIRKDKNGSLRKWIKVSDPNAWQLKAVVVWEELNGKLPKGSVVHHKDRNPLNDTLDNLQALTRAEHLLEHRSEFRKRRTKTAMVG